MSNAEVATAPRSQYVDFWNTVLVPKFVRWRHILVDGLTLHSAKVFPTLAVKPGDKSSTRAAVLGIPRSSLQGSSDHPAWSSPSTAAMAFWSTVARTQK